MERTLARWVRILTVVSLLQSAIILALSVSLFRTAHDLGAAASLLQVCTAAL